MKQLKMKLDFTLSNLQIRIAMPVFEATNHCCFQPANGDGDGETFWNKFGTLGRKKKEQEVKEVVAEGNYAIDSPGMPKSAEMPPEVTES